MRSREIGLGFSSRLDDEGGPMRGRRKLGEEREGDARSPGRFNTDVKEEVQAFCVVSIIALRLSQ